VKKHKCTICERLTRYADRRCHSCRNCSEPTHDEIAAECEAIRESWPDEKLLPPEHRVEVQTIAVPRHLKYFRKIR
jgi:hypothetical protein